MTKLTQRALEAVRAHQTGTILREEGNLFGRVRAKANGAVAISFYYRYRFDSKSKDVSCGTWPADSLASIRARRDNARDNVAAGINPAVEKKLVRYEQKEAVAQKLAAIEEVQTKNLTVKDLFDAWIADGVRRKDGNTELQRQFNADVLPAIGTIPMKDITEHDLRGVLRAMVNRGVNRSAVIVRNSLTQMFAWGRKRQPWRKLLVEGDPMELIEIEKIVAPEYDMASYRDRVLGADEIRELHKIIGKMRTDYETAPDRRATSQPLAPTTERAIWIMLSTLCRVGEMCKARWSNVNLTTGEWFIPKADVKDNVDDLTIYLSDFALAQFKLLHERTGHTAWCFTSKLTNSHLDPKSISKQLGDRQSIFKKDRTGGPRKPMKNRKHDNTLVLSNGKNGAWTAHDLRRTGATMMQALGVSLDIIDRCQNHILPGSKVRRHYMHHDYADEKRAAWAALGERLSQLLNYIRVF